MCLYVRDALPRHLDVPRSLCAAVEQRCARRLLFVSTLGAPHPMDWEPVPAGTLPSAALTARGADHDLYFAAGDSVEVARCRIVILCQSEMWSVAEGVFATRRLPVVCRAPLRTFLLQRRRGAHAPRSRRRSRPRKTAGPVVAYHRCRCTADIREANS